MSIAEKTILSGFCCQGHQWEIAVILKDRHSANWDSVWGCCRNQECPQTDGPEDFYAGVTSVEREDLQAWIDERSEVTT